MSTVAAAPPTVRRYRRASVGQHSDVREAMHADVDRICDHWPAIEDESMARGWASNRGYDERQTCKGDHSDPTLNAALVPDDWGAWIQSLMDLRTRLTTQAARAVDLDPPRAKNTQRGEGAELCVRPEKDGTHHIVGDKPVRIDGHPLCRFTCYQAAWRDAKAEGLPLRAFVARWTTKADVFA